MEEKEINQVVDAMTESDGELINNETIDLDTNTVSDVMPEPTTDNSVLNGVTEFPTAVSDVISERTVDNTLKGIEFDEQLDKLNTVSENLDEQRKMMYQYLNTDGIDTSFIDERLSTYLYSELEDKLKDDQAVLDFFITDDGQTVELAQSVKDKFNEVEFKRDLLLHIKSTDTTYAEIDKYINEMEKAREEFQKEADDAIGTMENNIFTMVDMMKEKTATITDPVELRKHKEIIKYIESGWDFSIIHDVLDKYPSVIKNVKRDMADDMRIRQLYARYNKKIMSNDCSISLSRFVSSNSVNRKSLEKTLLKPDQYKCEDLLIFMLMRFFAMADWRANTNIKRAHISMTISLKRAVSGRYPEDMQKIVIDNIAKLVARFD